MANHEKFQVNSWYKNNYNSINSTAIKGSLTNKILHQLIEKPFKTNKNLKILEVGANLGEHIPFVINDFSSYLLTDIRIPKQRNFVENNNGRIDPRGKIYFEMADVQNLPFANNSFDRVISTCLFHHLDDPIRAFNELRRVTKKNGMISILLPNDPGILYRFLRRLTTLRNAKKRGIYQEAQFIHALEHRNHYLQLRTLSENVFSRDHVSYNYFPLKIKSYNLNALTVLHVTKS